jgi:hypothetical protein
MADAADIAFAPQPQQGNQLCWAAATQLVVDVLNHPVDQPTIAAYAYVSPAQAQDFQVKVDACKANIEQFCNRFHAPILDELGFTFLRGSALSPPSLSEALITADIDAGRPIIFGWQFTLHDKNAVHFMVIVGYHRTKTTRKLKLRIYDPLPVGVGSVQTISYDNYTVTTPTDLHNDMGLPYTGAETFYQIQPSAAEAPAQGPPPAGPGMPGPVVVPALPATRLMEPRLAIDASLGAARAEVARRAAEEGARFSAGYPLPIIALGLNELGSAGAQALPALLRRDTGTVLYPVESGERVLDSFLMIKRGDEWVAGGYANTSVTRRLVGLRRQLATTQAERAEHYLLSVPALGAFFLARGTGPDARLVPVADDGSIRVGEGSLRANQHYRADALLPQLADAARGARAAGESGHGPR